MAAKKKLPDPVESLQPVEDLGHSRSNVTGQDGPILMREDMGLLSQCLDVLVEVYNSPTLAMSGWESRRRRANRPNPNLVSDMIRDLKAYLGDVQ